MNQPLLHVMIPAYGNSPYLNETLKSIPKEYFNFSKVTVVEDPSDSKNILEIMKNFPHIPHLINEKRLGIAGNFNRCLEISEGIYTQICGSDDFFNSKIDFEELIEVLQKSKNLDLIINKVNIIGENGKKIFSLTDLFKTLITPKISGYISCKKFMTSIAVGDWAYFPSIYWKTETFRKIKFSLNYHTAMDLDIFYRLCGENLNIYITNFKNIFYRRHKNSASVVYANEAKRFEEELNCQELGKRISKQKGFKFAEILLNLSLGIRFHIFLKLLTSIFTKREFSKKYLKLLSKKVK